MHNSHYTTSRKHRRRIFSNEDAVSFTHCLSLTAGKANIRWLRWRDSNSRLLRMSQARNRSSTPLYKFKAEKNSNKTLLYQLSYFFSSEKKIGLEPMTNGWLSTLVIYISFAVSAFYSLKTYLCLSSRPSPYFHNLHLYSANEEISLSLWPVGHKLLTPAFCHFSYGTDYPHSSPIIQNLVYF